MGCHTWCFVALPRKQKDWRAGLVKTAESTLKFLKKILNDKATLENLAKDEAYQHESNIEYFGKLLENETDLNKRLEYQHYIDQHKEALKKFTYDYFIESYQKNLDDVEKFLSTYDKAILGDPVKFFKWWNNVPEMVLDGFLDFGLYHIHDNKIYKESKFGEKLKYCPLGDSDFRIYDYEAEPCYTAQDCFDRCDKYDIELNEKKKKRIEDWFNEYPDTIVEFG
jgi:hypothetical protein